MPSPRPVFYFDLGSPYAYLALERCEQVLGVRPQLRPVLLGAIFKLRGYGSWALSGARALRASEIERRAERYGLPPIVWPDGWPVDGLTAMRCAVWADERGALDAFARAVFRAEFVSGADISDRAVLIDAAGDSGLDGEAMLEGSAAPAVKQGLRERTDEAWARGVRGVPSLEVGGAAFFGDDQLELAAGALSLPE